MSMPLLRESLQTSNEPESDATGSARAFGGGCRRCYLTGFLGAYAPGYAGLSEGYRTCDEAGFTAIHEASQTLYPRRQKINAATIAAISTAVVAILGAIRALVIAIKSRSQSAVATGLAARAQKSADATQQQITQHLVTGHPETKQ